MPVPPAIQVNDNIVLERIEQKHAEQLYALVEANRHHLREWLPWVDSMKSVKSFENYITLCDQQHEAGTDAGFMIMLDDNMIGRIGLHQIHHHNLSGAIGYWLAKEFTGKGIMKRCCTTLINYAFEDLNLNRIEIKCAVDNHKSAAIPIRLNFKHEGVLEQAEWVNDKFVDLHLYAMLKEEWPIDND